MEFTEKLFLLIIDKVIIAGIAFYLWHLYNKNTGREKEEKEKRKKLEAKMASLKQEKKDTELNERIELLEQQIEKFYWPITLCLKMDSAVWQRVSSLSNNSSELPASAGRVVEKEFLIPNHEKAVKIIGDNFHLIGENEDLIRGLVKYIRHVAVYKSLRLSGIEQNPIDVNEPFPSEIVEMLGAETEQKIKELERLRKKRWTFDS